MEYMESKMQDVYDASESEFNELWDKIDPPVDCLHPFWGIPEKVHNWRNYASQELQYEWENLTGKQKMIVSASLKDIADREDWD